MSCAMDAYSYDYATLYADSTAQKKIFYNVFCILNLVSKCIKYLLFLSPNSVLQTY